MDKRDLFTKRAQWWRITTATTDNKRTKLSRSMTILVLLGLVSLVAVGVLIGRSSTPPPRPTTTVAPPSAAPMVIVLTPTNGPASPTAIPTPICTSAADGYLKTITDQEQQNKWDVAAENVLSALHDPKLCPPDRPVLAEKYVTDGIEGLYARPFDPTKSAQEEVIERYQTLKHHAQRYGVTFPGPLGVAQRAAQTGKFLLAKLAYDEALEQAIFNPADIALVGAYADNCYNLGKWWTDRLDSPTSEEGKAYLSASYHISVKYKLGKAEAWARLKELIGPNEKDWPSPADTPLLMH